MRSRRGRPRFARLDLAVRALCAAGAVSARVADQILADTALAAAARYGLPAAGPARDRIRLASPRASRRNLPVGQVIEFRDGDLSRDVLLLAYVHSAGGARLIADGWPLHPITAEDDQGVRYSISWRRGPAATQLPLHPDPPHQIRWLDLTPAAGHPPVRIHLDQAVPAPEITVTLAAHSPGELLLDVIAARILAAARRSRSSPPGSR